jgi:hypothetical protein
MPDQGAPLDFSSRCLCSFFVPDDLSAFASKKPNENIPANIHKRF